MSVKASTATQPHAVPSAGPAAATRAPDEVDYPEGHWIAQSVWHGDAVGQAMAALRNHFRDCADVLVAMELVVYYERGDKTACLQPDVLVVFGVGRGNRSSYKVWEEGKVPDFVLEVASPSTAGNDARRKAREYAGIGVREYWRLDPEGSLMETPLEGWVASRGRYGPVEPVGSTGRGRHLRSRVLGLDLRCQRQDGAAVLAFRDPRDGGGVRRCAGGRRAAAADRGETGECRGETGSCRGEAGSCRGEAGATGGGPEARRAGAGPQIGGAPPKSHRWYPSAGARCVGASRSPPFVACSAVHHGAEPGIGSSISLAHFPDHSSRPYSHASAHESRSCRHFTRRVLLVEEDPPSYWPIARACRSTDRGGGSALGSSAGPPISV